MRMGLHCLLACLPFRVLVSISPSFQAAGSPLWHLTRGSFTGPRTLLRLHSPGPRGSSGLPRPATGCLPQSQRSRPALPSLALPGRISGLLNSGDEKCGHRAARSGGESLSTEWVLSACPGHRSKRWRLSRPKKHPCPRGPCAVAEGRQAVKTDTLQQQQGCQGCDLSAWLSEGLTGEVTFEQVGGEREQAIWASGRRAFQAEGQQAEGSSTSGQKARPMWLEHVNRGNVLGNEDGGQIACNSKDTAFTLNEKGPQEQSSGTSDFCARKDHSGCWSSHRLKGQRQGQETRERTDQCCNQWGDDGASTREVMLAVMSSLDALGEEPSGSGGVRWRGSQGGLQSLGSRQQGAQWHHFPEGEEAVGGAGWAGLDVLP